MGSAECLEARQQVAQEQTALERQHGRRQLGGAQRQVSGHGDDQVYAAHSGQPAQLVGQVLGVQEPTISSTTSVPSWWRKTKSGTK